MTWSEKSFSFGYRCGRSPKHCQRRGSMIIVRENGPGVPPDRINGLDKALGTRGERAGPSGGCHADGPRQLQPHYPQGQGPYMDPPTLSRDSRMEHTLRNRCRQISGLLVQTGDGLRALMPSALPLLLTTAAAGALDLLRV
jgi:hypothetical protein